jgi:hypothetical protein
MTVRPGMYKSWCPATYITKLCITTPNTCGPSVQNLLYVTLPVLRILTWQSPYSPTTGPEGSRRLRHPHFKTISTWRSQGCQLSGSLYPQEIFLVLISVRGSVNPKPKVQLLRIMSMKNSNGIIPKPKTLEFAAQGLNHATTRPHVRP